MTDHMPAPPISQLRPLLTVGDVAKILNLHTRSIRRMIASGELPVVRLGGAVRIRPEDVEGLVARNRQNKTKKDKNHDL